MKLGVVNKTIDGIRGRTMEFFSRGQAWRRRIALFLAVVGPGIITSNVDNDAGRLGFSGIVEPLLAPELVR